MRTFDVSLPELGFVAATRGLAGVGIGLLVAEHFRKSDHRRAVGLTLLAIGVLTTLPIAFTVFSRRRHAALADEHAEPLRPLAYAAP